MKTRLTTSAAESKPSTEPLWRQNVRNGAVKMNSKRQAAKVQQLQSAKQTKRIFAPFMKMIAQNERATGGMKEIQRLAHAELKRAAKPARAPKFPPVKPQIKSGSIIRIYVPPYNYDYQDSSGFGATANSWKNVGEFLAWSKPYSASVGPYSASAAAGVGIYFRPVAEDSFVRFSPLIKYTYSWRDRSQGGFTAHTSGYLAIRVVSVDLNGGDLRIEQDPRYQLWSDGTGWWETHSDSEPGLALFRKPAGLLSGHQFPAIRDMGVGLHRRRRPRR